MSDLIERDAIIRECGKYITHESHVLYSIDVPEERKHDADVTIFVCEHFKNFVKNLPTVTLQENNNS